MRPRMYLLLFSGISITLVLYIYIYRHISADDTVAYAVYRKLIQNSALGGVSGGISSRPDSCQGCFNSDYVYTVTPNWKCPVDKGVTTEGTVHLVVIVSSLVTNRAARHAVRSSWGSAAKNNTGRVRVVFLLGDAENEIINEKIRLEGIEYQDIVQSNVAENYKRLTMKTMMGLNWTAQACPSARHVMKTDDDVWVNIPALSSLLEYDRLDNTLGGHCYFGEYPRRIQNNSKWYVSYNEFSREVYPDYCAGVGYVMTARVAKEITIVSKDVPYFKMEDVYVGLCAQILGLRVKSLSGFYSIKKTENRCELKMNHIITSHSWKPANLIDIWNDQSQCSGVTVFGTLLLTKTIIYILIFTVGIFFMFRFFKSRRKGCTNVFKRR